MNAAVVRDMQFFFGPKRGNQECRNYFYLPTQMIDWLVGCMNGSNEPKAKAIAMRCRCNLARGEKGGKSKCEGPWLSTIE
jgi:hypothetical protein